MAKKQEERITKQVTDWDEMYPGRFLKAGQFKGRPVILKIAQVYAEKLPDQDGKLRFKGVITFEGTDFELALNKTNGICLRAMFGRELPKWAGKRVTFFPAPYEGDLAIRVAGSPDIEKDQRVEIALARKRPYFMTLTRTKLTPHAKGKAAPEPAPQLVPVEEPEPPEPGADEGEASAAPDPFEGAEALGA